MDKSEPRLSIAAAHWDRKTIAATKLRTRWWQDSTIISHINRLVCGLSIPGIHAGFNQLIKKKTGGASIPRAISVGCGAGAKELRLVLDGIVEKFYLYEISAERIKIGTQAAAAAGVADRMVFRQVDAFSEYFSDTFQLVYWNNSLHHMFDVHETVLWSLNRLSPGGIFAMDDFVGPARFQWSDRQLDFASRVRGMLPDRLLRNPHQPDSLLPKIIQRPNPEAMAKVDPTEAADSAAILSAVRRYFPDAEVIFTGGVIYGVALNDVIANFLPEDGPLLQALLTLDEALAHSESLYAVAIGQK